MEDKTITYSILGIVGVLAVVGLVMAFTNPTGMAVPPGAKLYGGELRQYQGDPMRPWGEEALRAEPVTYPPYQMYGHRKGWDRGLQDRNICPNPMYPIVNDPARVGINEDNCIRSASQPAYFCCKFSGQHGELAEPVGVYD